MVRIGKAWFAALLLIASAALASDDRFQLEYNKDFPWSGGRVRVEHSFGSVRIDTDSGSEVHVRATIRASDPEFGKNIRIIAEPGGGGVSIRTEYPSRFLRYGGNSSYSVDYRITVPRSAQLDVRNKFGSIEASDLGAPASFNDSYGSIRIRSAKGLQPVENAFGSIEISDAQGDTTINNKYGSIKVRDITGSLAVTNGFGSIEAEDIHGNLAVATQNSSVRVRGVEGSATLSNSFASVDADDVRGDVSITNQNGRIEARDIGGNATLRTTFASIRAERIGGFANVANENGSVQLEQIARDATVRTSFGSVFAKTVSGAIDVKNQNGAISVSLAGPACKPVSLHTSFSSIRVAVPSNASYAVNARTSFGRITSALPITTRTTSDDTLTGTIGGGACQMELVNSNGSITIEQE